MKQSNGLRVHYFLYAYCIGGFVLNFIAFYPGFLSGDGLDQYRQSLTGNYTDWHPPIMAVLWSGLNRIWNGPQIMLLMQLAMLWSSCLILLRAVGDSRVWRICIMALPLMPFVQNFAGYVIKDAGMALSWLLAVAIILRPLLLRRRMGFAAAACALLLLTYGSWLRQNALPGCLPLCYMWAASLLPATGWLKRVAIAVGLIAIIAGGQLVFMNFLVKPGNSYAIRKLYLHDLTGIYSKTGVSFFPEFPADQKTLDTAYMRIHYNAATYDNLWWNNDGKVTYPEATAGNTALLGSAWKEAIIHSPRAYIANRCDGFLYYLRIKKRGPDFYNYFAWMEPNEYGFALSDNVLSDVFMMPIKAQRAMPYMQPWFWFFLNITLLCFAGRVSGQPQRLVYTALVCSGLLYQLPSFFIFQTDTDFRYFYWNCICCAVAVVMLVYSRWVAQKL